MFRVREKLKDSDLYNYDLTLFIREMEDYIVGKWINDIKYACNNSLRYHPICRGENAFSVENVQNNKNLSNPGEVHGLACESIKNQAAAERKKFKNLNVFDWCGYHPINCFEILDPLKWDKNAFHPADDEYIQKIYKYISKNI